MCSDPDFRASIYLPGRENALQEINIQAFVFSKKAGMRPEKFFDMRFLKDFIDCRKLDIYLIMFTLAKETALRAISSRIRIETVQ